MENYEKLVSLVESMGTEAGKFYKKGNASAGTRLRAQCQELKALADAIRKEVQEIKKKED